MSLTTSKYFSGTDVTTSWTAPSGVTRVVIIPDFGGTTLVNVTPNTTYTITLSPGGVPSASFGSLWSIARYGSVSVTPNFSILWME